MTAMTAQDLVAEVRGAIAEVDGEGAQERINEGITVLDVREPAEYAEGHLPGAVNVPRGVLEFKVGNHPALADPAAPVLVYCKNGGRGALASRTLERMGFTGVINLEGGYDAWSGAGRPTEKDPAVC